MPIVPLVRIRVEGIDLLVAILDQVLSEKSASEKILLTSKIEDEARAAHKRGALAYAWEERDGKIGFMGPAKAASFFAAKDMSFFEGKSHDHLTLH